MQKAAGVIFFLAWLMCGCSVDQMLDDWRAGLIVIVALIVCIVTAMVITGGDE